jgi:hypothetical protein
VALVVVHQEAGNPAIVGLGHPRVLLRVEPEALEDPQAQREPRMLEERLLECGLGGLILFRADQQDGGSAQRLLQLELVDADQEVGTARGVAGVRSEGRDRPPRLQMGGHHLEREVRVLRGTDHGSADERCESETERQLHVTPPTGGVLP